MTASSLFPPRSWKEIRGLSPAWLACLASMAVAACLGSRMRACGIVRVLPRGGGPWRALGGTRVQLPDTDAAAVSTGKAGTSVPREVGRAGGRCCWCCVALRGSGCSIRYSVGPWCSLDQELVGPGLRAAAAMRPLRRPVADDGVPQCAGGYRVCAGDPGDGVDCERYRVRHGVRRRALPPRSKHASSRSRSSGAACVIVCAIAAVAGWWMFMRLEAIDSRGVEVRLPSWSGLSGRARAMPAAPPAFARRPRDVAARQEGAPSAAAHLRRFRALRHGLGEPVGVRAFAPASRTTLLFMLTVSLGSHPSSRRIAGQRRGTTPGSTLEWQVLLPMARWKQWLTKAAVALGIALTLTLGLPALLD